jgi:hypothetical protein
MRGQAGTASPVFPRKELKEKAHFAAACCMRGVFFKIQNILARYLSDIDS